MSEIIYHSAKCSGSYCCDVDCPYTHDESWEFDGIFYHAKIDAEMAKASHDARMENERLMRNFGC